MTDECFIEAKRKAARGRCVQVVTVGNLVDMVSVVDVVGVVVVVGVVGVVATGKTPVALEFLPGLRRARNVHSRDSDLGDSADLQDSLDFGDSPDYGDTRDSWDKRDSLVAVVAL